MDCTRLIAGILLGMLLLGCGATSPSDDDFVDVPGLGSTRIDVPRPTDPTPDACSVALRSGESVLERGVALREVGLFSGQAAMSDAELGEYLESELSEEWGEVAVGDPLIDLLIAAAWMVLRLGHSFLEQRPPGADRRVRLTPAARPVLVRGMGSPRGPASCP
jgi:hypothetical protein